MEVQKFAGSLLRMLRLQQNWSQETLCHGICAVSYLSKIEQGKVEANLRLLEELFSRLGVSWKESPEATALCDALYEAVFSWDTNATKDNINKLEENWDHLGVGPNYIDFMVIRAYHHGKPEWIPKELEVLLDARQRALLAIARNQHDEAYRLYPCPLTAFCVGESAYHDGNYTQALEYFQIAYDQAAREGYVYLMMFSQHYMANSCSDIGNLDAMYRHSRIAARLGRALDEDDLVCGIEYNIAATKVEFGDYENAYVYFSALEKPGIMALHKLAICCEAMGKREEALAALDKTQKMDAEPIERSMCDLVRYRLEHPDYLHDPDYGELLMCTFERIRAELHFGFARFQLRWVTEWLTANRQYRKAFEILQCFSQNQNSSAG